MLFNPIITDFVKTSHLFHVIIIELKRHKYIYSILNAISYAPHILLMTAEVNESQFPKFSFQFILHWSLNNTFKRKSFCRIPVFYNSLGPE